MKTTLTINQIIDEWLDNIDVLPISKYSYKAKVYLWFRWLGANKVDARSPKRMHVLNYKHYLEDSKRTQLTVDSYVSTVKLFYKYCESVRYCENIAVGIKSSTRYYGHRKLSLSADQATMLMQSVGDRNPIEKRDKLMITLMLVYGLRTCEVNRINIEDFDVMDGIPVLKIQRKGRREKAEVLSVMREVVDMLEDYVADRKCRLSDPLFISHSRRSASGRLSKSAISIIVKHRMSAIGIDHPKISAHSLRHTCGSLMIERGVDIESVRDIMGHTSTDTTRIYVAAAQHSKLIKNSPSKVLENLVKNDSNKPP